VLRAIDLGAIIAVFGIWCEGRRTNIIIKFAKRIAISIAALLDRKTGKSLHFATCTEAIYPRVITKIVLDA
jgi:hypothetical protein